MMHVGIAAEHSEYVKCLVEDALSSTNRFSSSQVLRSEISERLR